MDAFIIKGGRRLDGALTVNGAKNASLPLMAAALLADGPVTLLGVPDLHDTRNMLRLLASLGCTQPGEALTETPSPPDPRGLSLESDHDAEPHARYEIVKTMRAGICALGPMLARRGRARVSMPGGCLIGDRPVDLHLRGLEALGAEITLDRGDIVARAPAGGRLRGATVFLGGPFGSTVLGTANVLSAAVLAEGATVIESAACEPEIVDLAKLLNSMGARVSGAGSPRLVIQGVERLRTPDSPHEVMPDRIEAGTFLCLAAATNSAVTVRNCPLDALLSVTDRLAHVGVHVEQVGGDPMHADCRVTCDRVLSPVQVTTQPHPGFPTDLQAQLLALLCLADGNSVVTEKIFPERFMHVAELARMGANIHRQGATAVVTGVKRLHGAPVMASDLRASASLVIAGLAAEGETTVQRVYHLDRGYHRLEERLRAAGAEIERVEDPSLSAGAPGEPRTPEVVIKPRLRKPAVA